MGEETNIYLKQFNYDIIKLDDFDARILLVEMRIIISNQMGAT